MKIKTKIVKVGNSLYLNIPKKIVEAMGYKVGQKIEIEIKEGK